MPNFLVYNFPDGFRTPRAYIKRVNVLNAAATGVSQVDNVIEWSQSGYFIHMELNPEFYDWNSGHWKQEDVWDLPSSYAIFGGVVTGIGLFFSIPYYPDDACFNLAIHATLDLTLAYEGELPCSPSTYWFDVCELPAVS